MTTEAKALLLVEELNGIVYEQLDGEDIQSSENTPFTFHSNGNSTAILFLDQNVWDTENHSLFDDEDNEIPLKDYVINNTKKLIANINKIQL